MYYTAWYSWTEYQLSFAGVRNYSQNYWLVLTLEVGGFKASSMQKLILTPFAISKYKG